MKQAHIYAVLGVMDLGVKFVCPPPNSYVEILTPNVMVLGSGAFGRWLCHEGGALMNEISVLIRETPEGSLTHSAM